MRFMRTALALAERGLGRTMPNPSVACILVREGLVVGRGVTAPGGRPHAESLALAQAGDSARGAIAYVTLEPCAHESARGPACADALIAAGVVRVVIACEDPDPRTAGRGVARLRAAGLAVETGLGAAAARALNLGFFIRVAHGRPMVTLKLALSLDGCIALADRASRWITGEAARSHGHLERARHEVIMVGSGTLLADDPSLDVRLPGLEDRSPLPFILSRSLSEIPLGLKLAANARARLLRARTLDENLRWLADQGVGRVLVEGGQGLATALLEADVVDRMLCYRAPILIGDGLRALGSMRVTHLSAAHGRWRLTDSRQLGDDRLDAYERLR